VYGVRIPVLRKLAKEAGRNNHELAQERFRHPAGRAIDRRSSEKQHLTLSLVLPCFQPVEVQTAG
jgi:hypothetical protein